MQLITSGTAPTVTLITTLCNMRKWFDLLGPHEFATAIRAIIKYLFYNIGITVKADKMKLFYIALVLYIAAHQINCISTSGLHHNKSTIVTELFKGMFFHNFSITYSFFEIYLVEKVCLNLANIVRPIVWIRLKQS